MADSELTPESGAVLGTLGHELRWDILRAVLTLHDPADPTEGPTFSELQRAVGEKDSGRFNYHLDRLRGTLLEQTEDGEGYRPIRGWRRSIATLLAWGTPGREHRGPEPTAHDCPQCGGSTTAEYLNQFLVLRCDAHEGRPFRFATPVPYGAARDRELSTLVTLAPGYLLRDFERGIAGICPHCHGPVRIRLRLVGPGERRPLPETDDPVDEPIGVEFDCTACAIRYCVSLPVLALAFPRVATFLHERGVTPHSDPTLFTTHADPIGGTAIQSRSPMRVATTLSGATDRLRVVVDDSAQLVEATVGD